MVTGVNRLSSAVEILQLTIVNQIVGLRLVVLLLLLLSSQSLADSGSKRETAPSLAVNAEHHLYGLKAEGEKVSTDEAGSPVVPADKHTTVHLFGQIRNASVTFTKTPGHKGNDCNVLDHTEFYRPNYVEDGVYTLSVSLPSHTGYYYLCLLNRPYLTHQGTAPWLRIKSAGPLLPVPLQIFLIFVLLTLSGLFSGLNLGLMALDKNELQVITRCGTEEEKRHARAIQPVRKRGNYLLCSLLLGNVLVNSTLTILLDDMSSGLIAVVGSTLSIVIFGEIIPQAICSRHGLGVGARTIWMTYIFMLLTFPLSYPISKILDKLLGDEIGNVYDRERLMEYIKVTKTYNKLEEDEVNIISGALALKTKTVGEVMTRLEDVFMLPETAVLDFQTVSEIQRQGYSRIPVYRNNERRDIIGLLHAKDLAFVDPDDTPPTPLKTIIDYYNHPLILTYEDETLNNVLNHFKEGKSHMAFVVKIYGESDDVDIDPYREITGIITLEDVIEEILQAEIVDETDIITDNRKKQRRKETQHRQDFSDFAKIGEGHEGKHLISPQLALATFQYLSTAVEPFGRQYINQAVLRRLIGQKVYYHVRIHEEEKIIPEHIRTLYTAGKPADYFIMILEGRVKVIVGKEFLEFETGPFSYFGVAALKIPEGMSKPTSRQSVASTDGYPPKPPSPDGTSMKSPSNPLLPQTLQPPQVPVYFCPDYTVKIVESTVYMKIPRKVYLAAYRASVLQRQKDGSHDEDDRFRDEVETAFNSSLADGISLDMRGSSHRRESAISEHDRRLKCRAPNHVSLTPTGKKESPAPNRFSLTRTSLECPEPIKSSFADLFNGIGKGSALTDETRNLSLSQEMILPQQSLPSSAEGLRKLSHSATTVTSSRDGSTEETHLITTC